MWWFKHDIHNEYWGSLIKNVVTLVLEHCNETSSRHADTIDLYKSSFSQMTAYMVDTTTYVHTYTELSVEQTVV